ncbi:MAG TPA: efflux RND transporter periplasmic adaptor subunit [Hyphomonadaceae bacterium]|jgi:RND family efflux transporter MFP subunit|nr:efflux RND transporter periplasmic adaptor subunit [Hyphomonadaceae bacterium]
MRNQRSQFAMLAVALAFAGMAGAGCSAKSGEASAAAAVPEAKRNVEVEVHEVAQGLQANAVRASGMVAFKNETTLAFNSAGQIETLSVDQGAQVYTGQVLATLRRTAAGADAAEADLARKTAQQTFDRVSRLFASGAASQSDLDAATLALERARETISLTAPASGVILRRDAVRGQVVAAGQSVLQLGEAKAGVVVRASLSSTDLGRVKIGDAVEIEVRGREHRTGKVTQISPKMAAGMGAFEIEARFDDGADLRSGEVAEVLISTTSGSADTTAQAVLFIPAISLIDARADQAMVYVVDGAGVARRRAIRTEGVMEQGVAVVEGLKEGDQVITRGASMVRDGDRVAVKKG